MAKTSNLSLNLLNGADFVDYTALNTIFESLDALGLDYIVEQGVSGEWWYRKWKSGRAECESMTIMPVIRRLLLGTGCGCLISFLLVIGRLLLRDDLVFMLV